MSSWLQRLFPFGRGNVTRLAIAHFFTNLYFYLPVSTLYLQGKGLYQVNFVQLTEAVLRDMVFKSNVKTSARVKSRILEKHLRSIMEKIKKERRI